MAYINARWDVRQDKDQWDDLILDIVHGTPERVICSLPVPEVAWFFDYDENIIYTHAAHDYMHTKAYNALAIEVGRRYPGETFNLSRPLAPKMPIGVSANIGAQTIDDFKLYPGNLRESFVYDLDDDGQVRIGLLPSAHDGEDLDIVNWMGGFDVPYMRNDRGVIHISDSDQLGYLDMEAACFRKHHVAERNKWDQPVNPAAWPTKGYTVKELHAFLGSLPEHMENAIVVLENGGPTPRPLANDVTPVQVEMDGVPYLMVTV